MSISGNCGLCGLVFVCAAICGCSHGRATENPEYAAAAAPIPGTIRAQDFDNGGEGAAYHDTTPGNSGGAIFRQPAVEAISAGPDRLDATLGCGCQP